MPDHEAHPKGLAEGSVVCGDFTLIRLLRRAPLTSVWLACAAGDDEPRHVARVVHVRRPDGANRVERLRHAFDVLRELRHPAIPEVLAASVEGEEPVLVTPRIEGRTLRAIIWRQPRPQLSVVSRVVRVVASAIDALHAQEPRVVHRVVCPENIVVDVNGHVWLEECGVAHALVAAGWLPEAVSPNLAAYLSPDELKHVVHPRTDIFALATVAFEWLTGRVPFSGES